jgi:ABC-type glycerol-3-phosphate transport system substrate-binding protein
VRSADISKKYIYDLKPFIDSDAVFNIEDYYPRAFEPLGDDGLYVLPQTIYAPFLYYNKDLWSRNGTDEQGNQKTWFDLLSVAEQISRQSNGNVEIYGLVDGLNGINMFLSELERANINLLGTSPEELQFDQPAIRAALERVQQLAQSGVLYAAPARAAILARQNNSPENLSVQSQADIEDLVHDGRLAIWRSDSFSFDSNDSNLSFEVGAMPLPELRQPSYIPGQQGYVMSSGTLNPGAAWRWLSFLSRYQGMNNSGRFNVPARKSIAEATGFWNRFDSESKEVLQSTLNRPITPPPVFHDGLIRTVLEAEWASIISSQGNIDQSLSSLQSQLERLLQEQKQRQQMPAPERIVVATPEILPAGTTVLEFGITNFLSADLAPFAEQFAREHPDIRVRVRYIEEPNTPEAFTRVAAAYDCFTWSGFLPDDSYQDVLNLQPLIDGDATFDASDYPTGLLQRFRRGAELYGLPHTLQLPVLGYNQVRFTEAGLPSPPSNWTLDDFLATAQQLTQRNAEEEQYGYGMTYATVKDLRFFLDSFGASITSQEEGKAQPDFINPQSITAIQFYVNLLQQASPHDQLPGYREPSFADDVLSDGRTAMWLSSFADIFTYDIPPDSPDFKPAIAPPPRGEVASFANSIRVSGMYISSATPYTQACWKWMKFLSVRADAVRSAEFPARRSVAESDTFRKQAPLGAIDVYNAYLPTLERTSANMEPNLFNDPRFDPYWLYRAIDRAIQGANLKNELLLAQDLTQQYLDCVDRNESARRCARQVDAEYKGIGPVSQ